MSGFQEIFYRTFAIFFYKTLPRFLSFTVCLTPYKTFYFARFCQQSFPFLNIKTDAPEDTSVLLILIFVF